MRILGHVTMVVLVSLFLGACQPGAPNVDTDETPATTPAAAAPAAPSVAGNWSGVLNAKGQKFELLFKVNQSADGTVTAAIDSVSQGVKDIPVEEASFQDGRLLIEAKSILGVLDVKLEGADTLRGNWNQAGQSYPLELKRVD